MVRKKQKQQRAHVVSDKPITPLLLLLLLQERDQPSVGRVPGRGGDEPGAEDVLRVRAAQRHQEVPAAAASQGRPHQALTTLLLLPKQHTTKLNFEEAAMLHVREERDERAGKQIWKQRC